MTEGPWSRRQVVGLALAFEGGLAVVSFPLGWFLGQPPLATWRTDLRGLGLGFLVAVPMVLLGLAFSRWPIGPLRRIRDLVDEFIRPFFAPVTVGDLALISLTAGLGEELLFRAVGQAAFAAWLGPVSGLVLASLLFGLMHALTATYAVLATLAGLYLGAAWLLTDNLLVPVTAHAVYDFVMLVHLLREGPPTLPPNPPSGD